MTSKNAEELRSHGYTLFEDLLDDDEVARLRGLILGLIAELDPPNFHAPNAVPLRSWAGVSSSGVFLRSIFAQCPETEALMLRAPLITTLRAYLGDDLRLEDAGAIVSDASRPFFPWHSHIDGVDEGVRLGAGLWPRVERPERVLTLLYLDDIDAARGPLYVLPRRLGDPSEPPAEVTDPDWPGRVEVEPKAGTMVVLDQCTWHCARSLTLPGHRVIAGTYFAAAAAAPAPWADANLASHPLF